MIRFSQLVHALFDSDQVIGCKGTLIRKIIKEAIFNHGTDRDLRIRKELFDGLGQQMGCGMSDDLKRIRITLSDNGDLCIRLDQEGSVNQAAIHPARNRSFSQTSTDTGCKLSYRDGRRETALTAVRQRDDRHSVTRLQRKDRISGGRDRDRTCDPYHVKVVLYR